MLIFGASADIVQKRMTEGHFFLRGSIALQHESRLTLKLRRRSRGLGRMSWGGDE